MRAPDNFAVDRMQRLAQELRRRADRQVYRGRPEDAKHIRRCTMVYDMHTDSTHALLTYTRDGDELIEATYAGRADGCLHWSMSPKPRGELHPAPLPVETMEAWLVVFFGHDLGAVWMEQPKTDLGRQFQVYHARRLSLRGQPVEEVALGVEVAMCRKWLRAPELFTLLRNSAT